MKFIKPNKFDNFEQNRWNRKNWQYQTNNINNRSKSTILAKIEQKYAKLTKIAKINWTFSPPCDIFSSVILCVLSPASMHQNAGLAYLLHLQWAAFIRIHFVSLRVEVPAIGHKKALKVQCVIPRHTKT